jgi:hypothetical protein
MAPVFKCGLGAPLGSGGGWFSWIHEEDLVNIFLFLLKHKKLEGPINFTAPNPICNKEMTKILAEVLHRPTFVPAVPSFLLKLIMGEGAKVLLNGQRVMPKRLLDSGFSFKFTKLKETLGNLLKS